MLTVLHCHSGSRITPIRVRHSSSQAAVAALEATRTRVVAPTKVATDRTRTVVEIRKTAEVTRTASVTAIKVAAAAAPVAVAIVRTIRMAETTMVAATSNISSSNSTGTSVAVPVATEEATVGT